MNNQENNTPNDGETAQNVTSSTSRRRFTRNALVGGTVMLSLGNRAAWGQAVDGNTCLSEPTWLSWNAGPNGTFASFDPMNPEPGKEQKLKDHNVATFINNNKPMQIQDPPHQPPGTYWCATPEATDTKQLKRQKAMKKMLGN